MEGQDADAAKHETALVSILDFVRTSLDAATSDQPMPRAVAPRAVAGEVEAPAAPAPDGSTDRARRLAAQAPAVYTRLTETALGMAVGTSDAFAEAVTARSEKIHSHASSQLVQRHNFSEPEACFVTTALAQSFRNLAVAELLGDAAPSASSPRDPSPDELAAMLERFKLRGGNVDGLLAKAGVAPGQS